MCDIVYHVKNDKRSQRSAKAISDGLIECLRTTRFDDLTITALCNHCNIGRATFYRLFDEMDDVLMYKCDSFADSLDSKIAPLDKDQTIKEYYKEWMNNTELLSIVMDNKKWDIMAASHQKKVPIIASKMPNARFNEYHMFILTAVMVGALKYWKMHGEPDDVDDLVYNTSQAMRDLGMLI